MSAANFGFSASAKEFTMPGVSAVAEQQQFSHDVSYGLSGNNCYAASSYMGTSPQPVMQQGYHDASYYQYQSNGQSMQRQSMGYYFAGNGYTSYDQQAGNGYASYDQQTHGGYGGYTNSRPVRLNLDDFSDISDSESEKEGPAAKQPAKAAGLEATKVAAPPTLPQAAMEPDCEPAAEPSPCCLRANAEVSDDDAGSEDSGPADSDSAEQEEEEAEKTASEGEFENGVEAALSSAASEPESEATGEAAALGVAELLLWRAVVEGDDELKLNLYDAVEVSEADAQAQAPRTRPRATTQAKLPGSPQTAKQDDVCSWRVRSASEATGGKALAVKAKLEASENSWAAQQQRLKAQRASRDSAQASEEQVARAVKSILNKLTVEKFAGLFQQLLDCGIANAAHVELLIHEVFEKATTQHHFIDMYADLCVLLHEHFTTHPFDDSSATTDGKKPSFKRLLLDECQASFERLLTPPAAVAKPGSEEQNLADARYKTHMLGNIKLVGGLLARGMLAGKVGIAIMEELLSNPTPEALESLAALLTATGATFDKPGWSYRPALNSIFDMVKVIVYKKKCQPRERCLLKDLLELRAGGWQDRRPKKVERATTLAEVAQQAAGVEKLPTMRKVTIFAKKATATPKQAQPAPKSFDRDAFREGARKALLELRQSGDGHEALERLAGLGMPPAAKQPEEVCELFAHVVQEGSVKVRQLGFKAVSELLQGTWNLSALSDGLRLFLAEVAPELCCDVPALPKILAEELHTALQGHLSGGELDALRRFQAS